VGPPVRRDQSGDQGDVEPPEGVHPCCAGFTSPPPAFDR
jgi:hypothetical protein